MTTHTEPGTHPFIRTGTPLSQMVDALQTITNSVAAGLLPLPSSIDLWVQYVPAEELLTLATRFNVKIRYVFPEKPNAFAAVHVATIGTGSARIHLNVHCSDMDDDAVAAYDLHNRELAAQTASGEAVQTGPAGSAHGAPDFRTESE
jgi:hypothetical protein